MTKIPWTEFTWNVMVGCSKVSAGCQNCYAETAAGSGRLQKYPQYRKVVDEYRTEDNRFVSKWNGKTVFVESALEKPLRMKKPKMIFVNSMGDTFHPANSFEDIDRLTQVMVDASWHIYQLLTKRPDRALEYCQWHKENTGEYPFGDNVWLGVTAENQEMADKRIPILLQIPAAKRFISYEPALEKLSLIKYLYGGEIICFACKQSFKSYEASFCSGHECNQCKGARSIDDCCTSRWCTEHKTLECPHCGKCACSKEYGWLDNDKLDGPKKGFRFIHKDLKWDHLLDWVIVGAESGSNRRECKTEWVDSVVDQCKAAGVPCFVKQIHRDGKLIKHTDLAGLYPQEFPIKGE